MGRHRIPKPLQDYIRGRCVVDGIRPKAIHAEIAADPRLAALGVPSLKTVQNYVADYEARMPPPEARRYWTLADGDGDVVLPLLRYLKRGWSPELRPLLRRLSFGQVDVDTARQYVAIVRAVPTIPVDEAWSLANDYRLEGAPAAELDEYLAFTPWVDDGEAYVTAFQQGGLLTRFPRATWSTRDRILDAGLHLDDDDANEDDEPEPTWTIRDTAAAVSGRLKEHAAAMAAKLEEEPK